MRYDAGMSVINQCALCLDYAPLRESHVLPAFVFRWLRERAPTGHIRHSGTPNLRVQDGLKKAWLCDNCEARFCRNETLFATKLFHPWLSGQQRVSYTDWLLKFCISVSWRVLKHCKGLNANHVYTDEQEHLAWQAETTWRKFLLDQASHPGRFEQHFLILDNIESTDIPNLPNNINRYLTGAIEMDIVGSGRTMMTYAKLGRFCIFGVIQRGPDKWDGTKIHVKQGLLKPGSFTVPRGLIALFTDKASHAASAYEQISDLQQAKIDAAVMKNIDKLIESDQFAAMMADAKMFGESAILRRSS
jgi:hypothetical protein